MFLEKRITPPSGWTLRYEHSLEGTLLPSKPIIKRFEILSSRVREKSKIGKKSMIKKALLIPQQPIKTQDSFSLF